jgi:hypothetical protein
MLCTDPVTCVVQTFTSSQATPTPQGGGTDGGKLASLPPLLTTQP